MWVYFKPMDCKHHLSLFFLFFTVSSVELILYDYFTEFTYKKKSLNFLYYLKKLYIILMSSFLFRCYSKTFSQCHGLGSLFLLVIEISATEPYVYLFVFQSRAWALDFLGSTWVRRSRCNLLDIQNPLGFILHFQ